MILQASKAATWLVRPASGRKMKLFLMLNKETAGFHLQPKSDWEMIKGAVRISLSDQGIAFRRDFKKNES